MGDGRLRVPARYYQQFDADYSLDVPGEGFGGWQEGEIDISASHTAVVVMHAWDCKSFDEFPGVWRSCEYIPRSIAIAETVFPPLLAAVRRSPLPLFHVVGGGDYYNHLPGYQSTAALAGDPPPGLGAVETDEVLRELQAFRSAKVWRGAHNNDRGRLAEELDFLEPARPLDGEPIAEDSHQLVMLCRRHGINHLVYAGFAIDACLLHSPGGMVDMSRCGVMCSAIRQAVTAVECKESARAELHKQVALWRVAITFGFVFDAESFAAAITADAQEPQGD